MARRRQRPEDQNPDPTPERPEPEPENGSGTPAPSGGGDIIGKQSGFNYTQRWGSRLGQNGSFQIGSRPPAKADWDAMTPEERAAVGIPDWDTFSRAHDAWQKRYQPGNDLYEERTKMAEAIVGSGATTWDQVRQALIRAGFSDSIHENGPMFKQLQMAFEGAADPSGRYHWTPGGWVDVSTSDLAKRGIPGMADYNGPRLSGMEAIYGALPQSHDIQRFQQWLNNPGANAHQLLQYQHTGKNGEVMYGTGRYQYDQFGNVIDTTSGQRVGHYYPGDTRVHYGGGGGNVDWGDPTMPAGNGGSAGGANPLQGLFGQGNGAPGSQQDLLRQIAQLLGIELPQEDLTPQIIPGAILPGQDKQPGITGTDSRAGGPTAARPGGGIPPMPPASSPQTPPAQPLQAQPTQTGAWGTSPGSVSPTPTPPSSAGIYGTGGARPSPTMPQQNFMTGEPQPGMQPQSLRPRQPRQQMNTVRQPRGLFGGA